MKHLARYLKGEFFSTGREKGVHFTGESWIKSSKEESKPRESDVPGSGPRLRMALGRLLGITLQRVELCPLIILSQERN